jgi:hypothetical protein
MTEPIEYRELDLAEVDAVYAKLQELGELIESMHYSVRHRTVDEALVRIFPGREPIPDFWRNFVVGTAVVAHSNRLTQEAAIAIGKEMVRGIDIEVLKDTAKELPVEHREKPGLIRAAEILKYAPKEIT